MQRRVHQIPRQGIDAKHFIKNKKEKIGHLVQGRKAETIEKVPERRTVKPLQQTCEIRHKTRLPSAEIEQMHDHEKDNQHNGIFPEMIFGQIGIH